MKLQVDPSITYRINAGSFSIKLYVLPRVHVQLKRIEEAEATNSPPIRCQSPQVRKTIYRNDTSKEK